MILVTGGSGFVGAHLLYRLVKEESMTIRALKRSHTDLSVCKSIFSYYTSNVDSLFSKIEWVDGDLLDVEALTDALEGVEYVYHAAAVVSFNSSRKKEVVEVNQKGTANLADLSRQMGVKKFCFVSSIAALGSELNGIEVTEESSWKPTDSHSTYSISKFWAEMEVWRASREGLNVVVVNPSVIVGAGSWSRGSSKFFPTVYKGLSYYGKGGVGFVGVEDVVRSMTLLMKSSIENERFVLNSQNMNYREFLTAIANGLKVKAPQKVLTPFIGRLAWQISYLMSKITRREPLVTRESIATSFKTSAYNSNKVKEALEFEFTPIHQVIEESCKRYLTDLKR